MSTLGGRGSCLRASPGFCEPELIRYLISRFEEKEITKMKQIKQRSIALAATFAIAFITLATSAPRAEASNRYQLIAGRVLKIDRQGRRMLIADQSSKKLYLVNVAKEASFKITFGKNMQMSAVTLDDVDPNNAVWLRCTRTDKEHFARLDDGREVIVLTAAH
jgi:hypothetical protein